jgi:hypothetical protein
LTIAPVDSTTPAYAKDCVSRETQTGMLNRIQRMISLDGDLAEQRRRLLEIADTCPVQNTPV